MFKRSSIAAKNVFSTVFKEQWQSGHILDMQVILHLPFSWAISFICLSIFSGVASLKLEAFPEQTLKLETLLVAIVSSWGLHHGGGWTVAAAFFVSVMSVDVFLHGILLALVNIQHSL